MIKKIMLSSLFTVQAFAAGQMATYTVPTAADEADLKPYAQFTLDNFSAVKKDGAISQLKYILPEELAGYQRLIEMNAVGTADKNGNVHLESTTGDKAVCVANKCDVKYGNLNIDRDEVLEKIFDKSNSFQDFDSRVKIADKFVADPVGVIEFQDTP
jgi:hypothetical protein